MALLFCLFPSIIGYYKVNLLLQIRSQLNDPYLLSSFPKS